MKTLTIVVAFHLIVFFSGSATATEYREIAVVNGGSITGVVKVRGEVPNDEIKEVKKDKDQCGVTIDAQKYVFSAAGEVKWAVAMLEGIGEGKKLDREAELQIDNKRCRFEPHVLVAPTGGILRVRNSDPLLHNTHFFLVHNTLKKTVINLALPRQGQVIAKSKILRKPGLLSVECDAHNFMQGYVWSLPHPYGAVTDEKGEFRLTDIPAGTYILKVWHEALGEKSSSVTVKSGMDTKVVIEYE